MKERGERLRPGAHWCSSNSSRPENRWIGCANGAAISTVGYGLWESPFWRYSEDEFIAAAKGCIGVMGASGTRITRRILEALPELRYISKFGIGVDSIDVAAATERAVLVANTPEDSQVTTVCEHTIALMLALQKQLLHGIRNSCGRADGGEPYSPHPCSAPRSALLALVGSGAAWPSVSQAGA